MPKFYPQYAGVGYYCQPHRLALTVRVFADLIPLYKNNVNLIAKHGLFRPNDGICFNAGAVKTSDESIDCVHSFEQVSPFKHLDREDARLARIAFLEAFVAQHQSEVEQATPALDHGEV